MNAHQGTGDRLDSAAWAAFFIWIGVAIFTDIGWGWTLVGIGLIILAAEAIRWMRDLPISGFWIACGIIMALGGIWDLLKVQWPLLPVLLIALGLVMLWGVFSKEPVRS